MGHHLLRLAYSFIQMMFFLQTLVLFGLCTINVYFFTFLYTPIRWSIVQGLYTFLHMGTVIGFLVFGNISEKKHGVATWAQTVCVGTKVALVSSGTQVTCWGPTNHAWKTNHVTVFGWFENLIIILNSHGHNYPLYFRDIQLYNP